MRPQKRMGFTYSAEVEKPGFFKSIQYGAYTAKYWVEYTLECLKMLLTGEVGVNQLSGPVDNTIPGLLDCKIGKMDDKTLFYYEVTSKQSLQSVFEQRSIGAEALRKLFEQLLDLLEELGQYLAWHRTVSFCSRSWFLQMQIWRTFPSVICRESRDTQAVFRSRSGS